MSTGSYNGFTGHETATTHSSHGCRYHNTDVVTCENGKATLNTGGWSSVTTKRRLNQWAAHYGHDWRVYQKDWDWYVWYPETGETVEFHDGVTVAARSSEVAS